MPKPLLSRTDLVDILKDELAKGNWGDIDPDWLLTLEPDDDNYEQHRQLMDVLDRVTDRLLRLVNSRRVLR